MADVFGIRVVSELRGGERATSLWIAVADTPEQAVRIVEAQVGPGCDVEASGHVFSPEAIEGYDLRPGMAHPV